MRTLSLMVAAVLAACTHPPASVPAEATAAPAEAVPTSRLLSPLMLSWEQRALSPTAVSLVAHVKRIAPMNLPLLVRIEVPAGAKLMSGRSAFELPANTEAVEVTEPIELAFDAVPAGDVVLHVDGESQAAGFHLFAPYRFGRVAPLPEAAQPSGPPVKKGDRVLGPSIPLK